MFKIVSSLQLHEETGTVDLEVEDDESWGRGTRRQEDDCRSSAEGAWWQQGLQSGQKSRLNQQTAFQRKFSWKSSFTNNIVARFKKFATAESRKSSFSESILKADEKKKLFPTVVQLFETQRYPFCLIEWRKDLGTNK